MLCLVVDRQSSLHPLAETVEAAFRHGADWLQLRERGLEGAAWLDQAETLAAAAHRGAEAAGRAARVLVNRRLDIALAIGADGAHLGFDAVRCEDARALIGTNALLGASTHAPEEVRDAAGRLDYVHLAPIFTPLSKPAERAPLGTDRLREAARAGIAVLAQGGIDASRVQAVIAAGAAGIAVTGHVLMSPDPGLATAALRDALDNAAR